MANSRIPVSLIRLRECLFYDPETGVFIWQVVRSGGRAKPGVQAGAKPNVYGYIKIGIDGQWYPAHRLAWFYVYGEWPKKFIDHIDGQKTNNRIKNLRDVSTSVNMQNRKIAPSHSVTGLLGATPSRGRFQSTIKDGDGHKFLGRFDTAEEAHQVYLTAKRKMHEGCSI